MGVDGFGAAAFPKTPKMCLATGLTAVRGQALERWCEAEGKVFGFDSLVKVIKANSCVKLSFLEKNIRKFCYFINN